EHVAGQALQHSKGPLIIGGDLRIFPVVDQLVSRVHVRAAYDDDMILAATVSDLGGPRGTARRMTRREVCREHDTAKADRISVMENAIHFHGRPVLPVREIARAAVLD